MRSSVRSLLAVLFFGMAWSAASPVEAGGRLFRRRERPVVETSTTIRPEDQVAPSPMLGQFRSAPYVTVGGGFNGLGDDAREQSLAVYGPLSAFRTTTAPVSTIVRGYDGVPVRVDGISFSNPNQPSLSPVLYPTRSSNYAAVRYQTTPPQAGKALMWIDLN